jgi:D-aminopeptidase
LLLKEYFMKIYIHTDIEGIAGWVFYASWSNSLANAKHLERMNHLLTDEVHAAVKACLMMEAEEIYINDSHGSGYNIRLQDYPWKRRARPVLATAVG